MQWNLKKTILGKYTLIWVTEVRVWVHDVRLSAPVLLIKIEFSSKGERLDPGPHGFS